MTATIPPPSFIERPSPELDIRSMLLAEWARDSVVTIGAGTARSRQTTVGPSEIGAECSRKLAYKIAGTPGVNISDPLKSMFGTGLHEVLAQGFRGRHPGRYLIEHGVTYRDITGTVDLFDRFRHVVIDWKTTTRRNIKEYARNGVPYSYRVQANIYAQGLIAQGERVDTIALIFFARDGSLLDTWAWTDKPEQAVADNAIDRYYEIADLQPAAVASSPGGLCLYCPNYREHSTDISVACPGKTERI